MKNDRRNPNVIGRSEQAWSWLDMLRERRKVLRPEEQDRVDEIEAAHDALGAFDWLAVVSTRLEMNSAQTIARYRGMTCPNGMSQP